MMLSKKLASALVAVMLPVSLLHPTRPVHFLQTDPQSDTPQTQAAENNTGPAQNIQPTSTPQGDTSDANENESDDQPAPTSTPPHAPTVQANTDTSNGSTTIPTQT